MSKKKRKNPIVDLPPSVLSEMVETVKRAALIDAQMKVRVSPQITPEQLEAALKFLWLEWWSGDTCLKRVPLAALPLVGIPFEGEIMKGTT
jgi:hypothetical protein